MIQNVRSLSICLLMTTIALLVTSPAFAQEGYVLDGFGGVHAINGAPVISPAASYFGFDAAEAIVIVPSGDGYLVLDAFGGVHPGGTAGAVSPAPPYFGFDIARDIALTPSGSTIAIPSTGSLLNDAANTRFQSLFGTSFSGSKLGAENLMPLACNASGLRATTTTNTDPGNPRVLTGSETVTVTVMVNEVDSALSCTISAGQSQCTAAGPVGVSINDRVGYKFTYANLTGSMYLHKGFICS